MIRTHCSIFWVDKGIHSKMEGKLHHALRVFGVDTTNNLKNITMIAYFQLILCHLFVRE